MDLKILSAAHHRNGVGGVPFWAVIVEAPDDFGDPRKFACSVFTVSHRDGIFCSVFCIDKLAEGNVQFGENSWRGDQFYAAIREQLPEFLGRTDAEVFGDE